jgi:hypothetical protein
MKLNKGGNQELAGGRKRSLIYEVARERGKTRLNE